MPTMIDPKKVTIACYGGCGRTVTLRASRVHKADYYLCHSKASGLLCEQKLPPLLPGKVRLVDHNAAASFWGFTDVWPDAKMAAALARARGILAAGLTQLAIEKARR
jgi:hypothetical protein